MKTLVSTTLALVLLGAAPALSMTCCGSGKGKTAICHQGQHSDEHEGQESRLLLRAHERKYEKVRLNGGSVRQASARL